MDLCFYDDVSVNGSWEMQFMNEMYPDKSETYKKEKICKNRKKIEEGNVNDNDIIIRAYAMWLKMKLHFLIQENPDKDKKDFNKFLRNNDKLFYKVEYFGCDWYPKKWKLDKNNVFIKSVIEIEEDEKNAFFDSLEKQKKKVAEETKKSIIDDLQVDEDKKIIKKKKKNKKKKTNIEEKIIDKNNLVNFDKLNKDELSELRKERDNCLKKLNALQEKTDNLENIKDEYKEDYKIVKSEVNKLRSEFTKKTDIDPDEFYKVKEFWKKYYDKEEILEKQLNKKN